jgi:aminoglycoside 6'-N-acetyltransferase
VAPADVAKLVRIARTPEVDSRWGDEYLNDGWPFDDPSAVPLVVLVEGRVVGMIQYSEESDPKYRHAAIDIFLDPAVHSRGHGRDAVRALARYLMHDRGHHRLVIDPAADNEPAIRSYSAVGFRPVGVMRRYEQDANGGGWHDGLLMDLLVEELT